MQSSRSVDDKLSLIPPLISPSLSGFSLCHKPVLWLRGGTVCQVSLCFGWTKLKSLSVSKPPYPPFPTYPLAVSYPLFPSLRAFWLLFVAHEGSCKASSTLLLCGTYIFSFKSASPSLLMMPGCCCLRCLCLGCVAWIYSVCVCDTGFLMWCMCLLHTHVCLTVCVLMSGKTDRKNDAGRLKSSA